MLKIMMVTLISIDPNEISSSREMFYSPYKFLGLKFFEFQFSLFPELFEMKILCYSKSIFIIQFKQNYV